MRKPVAVPRAVVTSGIPAALDNAHRLLADARTLRATGSCPTAQALAILALEEAAKAIIWAGLLGEDPEGDPIVLSEENHHPRLRTARQVFSILEAFVRLLQTLGNAFGTGTDAKATLIELQDIAEAAASDNLSKMRGIYVDAEPHGLRIPNQQVSPTEADDWIERAAAFIAIVEVLKKIAE